jgi:hypothetical protein
MGISAVARKSIVLGNALMRIIIMIASWQARLCRKAERSRVRAAILALRYLRMLGH